MASLARFLELGDALAADLERFLRGYLPGSTVTRTYVPEIDDDGFEAWIDAQKPMGVYVVPVGKTSEIETRDSDIVNYRYAVIFAEKCKDAGRPTQAWMDVRVTAVDAVDDEYGDMRNARQTEEGLLWAGESEIMLAFDPDIYRENHAFWAVWGVTLRESMRVA